METVPRPREWQRFLAWRCEWGCGHEGVGWVIWKQWPPSVWITKNSRWALYSTPRTGPDLQALADLPRKCQPVAQGHTHSQPARTHRRSCQQRDKYQPYYGGAHVQHLLHSYSKSRRWRRSGHVWFVKGGSVVEVSIRLPASFVELWVFTMWRSRLLDRIISIPSKSVGWLCSFLPTILGLGQNQHSSSISVLHAWRCHSHCRTHGYSQRVRLI